MQKPPHIQNPNTAPTITSIEVIGKKHVLAPCIFCYEVQSKTGNIVRKSIELWCGRVRVRKRERLEIEWTDGWVDTCARTPTYTDTRTHGHTDIQTHRHTNTRTYSHTLTHTHMQIDTETCSEAQGTETRRHTSTHTQRAIETQGHSDRYRQTYTHMQFLPPPR